jgi:hypothetical protein
MGLDVVASGSMEFFGRSTHPFCATRFFRRIQQKSAKINGSRWFAHAKNSLLAKACDCLILESQLTPGLDIGLRHSRAPANQNTAQNHPGLCWNFFRVESPA